MPKAKVKEEVDTKTFEDDIIDLLGKERFWVEVVLAMQRFESRGIKTIGVSVDGGKIKLRYNPEYYFSMPKKQRLADLVHEAMHVTNRHFSRKAALLDQDGLFSMLDSKAAAMVRKMHPSCLHKMFNYAADMAINQYIEDISPDSVFPGPYGFPEKLAAEEYMVLLLNLAVELQGKGGESSDKKTDDQKSNSDSQDGSQQGNQPQDGEQQGGQPQDGHSQEAESGDPGDGSPSPGNPQGGDNQLPGDGGQKGDSGSGGQQASDGEAGGSPGDGSQGSPNGNGGSSGSPGGQGNANGDDHSHEHGDNCPACNHPRELFIGELRGDHSGWDASQEDVQTAEAQATVIVKSCHDRGLVPANLKSMFDDILKPRLNVRAIVRSFAASCKSAKIRRTWLRVNRRLPHIVKGKKQEVQPELIFCIDTSGSISNRTLQLFGGILLEFYKEGVKILVIEIDAKVQRVYEFKGNIKDYTPTGRGGTAFVPAFQHIVREKMQADGVIYLTDGFGDDPPPFRKCPVLWVVTHDGQRPASWGKVLFLQE